eukprot:SAG11_NODE_5195_length_1633_cov_3.104954_1_plen_187_part_00
MTIWHARQRTFLYFLLKICICIIDSCIAVGTAHGHYIWWHEVSSVFRYRSEFKYRNNFKSKGIDRFGLGTGTGTSNRISTSTTDGAGKFRACFSASRLGQTQGSHTRAMAVVTYRNRRRLYPRFTYSSTVAASVGAGQTIWTLLSTSLSLCDDRAGAHDGGADGPFWRMHDASDNTSNVVFCVADS